MNFIENFKIKSAFKKHVVLNRLQNVGLCIDFKKKNICQKPEQWRS